MRDVLAALLALAVFIAGCGGPAAITPSPCAAPVHAAEPPPGDRGANVNIQTAAQALLDLRERKHNRSEWEGVYHRLEEALFRSSAEEIRMALEADVQDLLPVDLKSEMYERLLKLEGREPDVLRQYAWHLQLHGPDWDDKAELLLAEAEQREPHQ